MIELTTAIGTVLAGFLGWIATATTALIGNVFVQFGIGIAMSLLVLGSIIGLAKRSRRR